MKDFIKNKLAEARLEKKKSPPPEEGGGSQYDKIQALLGNEIFNHSEIIRKLWGENKDDATARSLFKKKLDRATNDTGSVYSFDEGELTKIATILMNTSTEIRKQVGKQGKG